MGRGLEKQNPPGVSLLFEFLPSNEKLLFACITGHLGWSLTNRVTG
jgi:hypothetical protein